MSNNESRRQKEYCRNCGPGKEVVANGLCFDCLNDEIDRDNDLMDRVLDREFEQGVDYNLEEAEEW